MCRDLGRKPTVSSLQRCQGAVSQRGDLLRVASEDGKRLFQADEYMG